MNGDKKILLLLMPLIFMITLFVPILYLDVSSEKMETFINNLPDALEFIHTMMFIVSIFIWSLLLGLYDLYPEASLNNNYTIESNSEIEYKLLNYGLKQSGAIMRYCGRPTENVIEMVLLAFSENQKQYYVPNGTKQRISKAIKSNIIFNNVQYDDDNNKVIIPCKWNENTHTFDVI